MAIASNDAIAARTSELMPLVRRSGERRQPSTVTDIVQIGDTFHELVGGLLALLFRKAAGVRCPAAGLGGI
jgi:hypothetical protein